MVFSVIICTRNRCKILHHCLQSFVDYGSLDEEYEILIIDNASTDSTKEVIEEFKSKVSRLGYIYEPTIGLSYARNRGALESKAEWLLYIDDDAKLRENTLSEYCRMIKEYDFKLFTGIFRPWYLNEPPAWMKDRMVSYILKGSPGIRPIGEDYVSGGIMGVEKRMLIELGMFNTELGMKGEKIGYGEESDLQQKAAKRNYPIGINTNFVIDHLVGEHKYKASWFINSAFAKGADAFRIDPLAKKFRWRNIIFSILERGIKNFLRTGYKLMVERKYYPMNWYIDNVSPLAGFYGIIRAKLNNSANQK